jgi:hypothetical protein
MQEMIELKIDETKAVVGGAKAMPVPVIRLPPEIVKAIDFIESLFRPHQKLAAQ